ncbi:hypothetical protein SAMN05421690_10762 [Nitrosomonas sp. Nm51]|uniref:hypothetical protein n=1 Tax=Nitrosomonas sp. Nm51 TaxID=133720 RepID=UPI0008D1E038|nr:hypothetical protein [Nitrosomonas sp. Nm51]SER78390.1 hypothetical protein SAMN05421690_10762 [Nitrosomonas sp. Nm51]
MSPNNPVTDDNGVTSRDAVTATPVADKSSLVKPKSKQQQNKSAKPKIDKLFVYDASLGVGPATAIRDSFYKGAKLEPITTWSDLVTVLSRYSEIKTLVLDTHSIPGNLLIDGNSPSTDDQKNRLTATAVQVTGRIIFEGCSIMGDPATTAKLVSGITGPSASVTGYTFFSVVDSITVELIGDEDEEGIKTALEPFKQYLLPGNPSAKSLAGKSGPVDLYRRWFRRDLDETSPENETDQRAIKQRSDMTDVRVRTAEDAERVRSEYQSPVEPAYIVTIEDVQAVKAE